MPETAHRIDRLYRLLPAIHRARDAEQGEPLRALLQVIAGQINVVEDDIAQLYENWFVETCDTWAVPYIADLVGWRAVDANAVEPSASSAQLTRFAVPRRDVANTIRNRRRKGTLALLEELARDVANWPARAVEFVHLLAVTPALNHARTFQHGRGSVDVRRGDVLDRLGGPFECSSHTVEVRRIDSSYSPGRYNASSVGLFVWRLQPQSVTHAPACCLEEVGPEWYAFSALGNDTQLTVRPEPDVDASSVASPINAPGPISRRQLHNDLSLSTPSYYGLVPGTHIGKSFAIWAEDWPSKGAGRSGPIAPSEIIAADLSDFQYSTPRNKVAVDPVRGRIAFPAKQLPKRGVWVSYHYAFSANMAGGEYTRPLLGPGHAELIRVQGQEQLRHALHLYHAHKQDDGAEHAPPEQPEHAIIEIGDSGVYVLPFNLVLAPGHTLHIRAAQNTRPVIRLLDWQTDRPDSLGVTGGAGSRFTLDGVVVSGRGMRIEGEIASVTIRHATLVPGWNLEPNCDPKRPAEPSIEIVNSGACLVIEHSIVGSIQINIDEVMADPIQIHISDSIVDATGSDHEKCEAIGAAGAARAHALLSVARSTVIGSVLVHAIELAENSIFSGCVTVARRQIGCVRFCSFSQCSRTPRRFECQPDLAQQEAADALRTSAMADNSVLTDTQLTAARAAARVRVRPRFTSLRFGHAGYCQLASDCAPEITRGAEDESELGAFHDLYQPQRIANLQTRLEEFVPSAAEVGIIFVT